MIHYTRLIISILISTVHIDHDYMEHVLFISCLHLLSPLLCNYFNENFKFGETKTAYSEAVG